jgi:hypothetical protein
MFVITGPIYTFIMRKFAYMVIVAKDSMIWLVITVFANFMLLFCFEIFYSS